MDPLNVSRITLSSALATLVSALVMPLSAQAGTLQGTVRFHEPLALPPDAVLEVVLIDGAIADAPARELGRVRLRPTGQPPFRFSLPYRESDLRPTGRYSLRATVRSGDRLVFTTDTHTRVLNDRTSQPVSLWLKAVGSGGPPPSTSALGRLPASWRGDLPGAGGAIRWQVDLASDGSFQLRQTFLNRPAPNRFDDIGRWRLEPATQRLVLQGGREAPLLFQPLEGGTALRKLDLQGAAIRSRHPDRLERLPRFTPIDPQLHLLGLFTSMADAPSLRLCATGARLPVAMEGDYRRLEEAYRRARGTSGAGLPLLVNLEGRITNRPSAEEGRPAQRTVVVERFVGVHPGKGCPTIQAAHPGSQK